MRVLELNQIAYTYPGSSRASVSEFVLRVAPGAIVALLGPNGSGKSTVGRVASGSLLCQAGSVAVDGVPLDECRAGTAVGYVRQDPLSQFVAPTVFEEVAFGPSNLGLAWDEVERRAREALEMCLLGGYERRLVSELSGGEQQRLALAGVLALRPRYLVLDEVTSQLDEWSREEIRLLVRRFADNGVGIMMITHDPEDIEDADECVYMREGHIVNDAHLSDAFFGDAQRASGADSLACRPACSAGAPFASVSHASQQVEREWQDLEEPSRISSGMETSGAPAALGGTMRVPAALVADSVGVHRGDSRVLADVSLRCGPGEILLVAGPSGSGKSTLAHVFAGLLAPDSGSVSCDEGPVEPRSVGLCLQRPEDQVFCNSVLEDVALGPLNRGLSQRQAEDVAREALRRLDVSSDLWGVAPLSLSGGQRRRVALAGILALQPGAFVFDEPTVGLDAEATGLLLRVITELAREGHPVVVVSHDLADWLGVATSAALLAEGRVVWQGSATALAENPGLLLEAGLLPPRALRTPEMTALSYGEQKRHAGLAGGQGAFRPRERQPAGMLAGLGRYANLDTPLHRLDARVKLGLLLCVTVAVFGLRSPWALAAAALLVVACARLACIGWKSLVGGLKPMAVVLAFSLVANALVVDGSADLALVGTVGISASGLVRGCMAVGRIAVLVGASLVFCTTTSSSELVGSLVAIMSPLDRCGVPVADLSMALSIALRFIPLCAEELLRLRDAQRARGIDFDSGGLARRVERWASVLVPLVVALVRRANDLSCAMRERGYAGASMTRPSRALRWVDVVVLLGGIAACVAACMG